ncbi:MAG: hypothetical protein H6Q89_3202, partial [Myxococcaceae bacterium]|nr:hypothetical protein [Myxococcaceae bacterium]
EVFKAWTTVEGMKSFLAPDAKVELKPGGAYEPYFVLTVPAGMRGAEGCTVVSFQPNKQLVFTWNFPPTIPALREAKEHTQVAIDLVPEGAKTKVRLTQTGWKEGADWEKGRAYFERAWGFVLARLERRFTRGPIDWKYGWAPAQLTDLGFIQGQWRWAEGKASREESWVASPTGLIGSYREVGADPAFYELAVIEQEGEELVLSMRMFGPGLKETGMTKAGPLRFVLESVDEKDAVFLGDGSNKAKLIYRLADKSTLEITLERPGARPEVFRFTRL